MQSAHWILNFDEESICRNGSRMAPEVEEAILALHFAPPAGDRN
uniref:Uncharacterized protein n=1 Tax=Salix viminalis TaxID=40686 RepID=A0A6N2MWN6_SALVM